MRAWNLLVKDARLVNLIMFGFRDHLRFDKEAKSVKRVHVGDTVIIHNYFGPHCQVEKKVIRKRMVWKTGKDNRTASFICIWFD